MQTTSGTQDYDQTSVLGIWNTTLQTWHEWYTLERAWETQEFVREIKWIVRLVQFVLFGNDERFEGNVGVNVLC